MASSIALGVIDIGLKTATTPRGIISFEFCGFTASCETALMEWGVKGQALAMLSLGIDYLYLLLYPALICVGLLLVAPRVPSDLYRVTILAACSSPAMSVADSIENYALIQIILNESGSTYGLFAGIFATIKFTVIGITLSWLLFTFVKYVLLGRSGA